MAHQITLIPGDGIGSEITRATTKIIEIAPEYPELQFNDKIVGNMAMQMVMNTYQFDCIVTTHLFGDIRPDLASDLVEGLGMAPGASIGKDINPQHYIGTSEFADDVIKEL